MREWRLNEKSATTKKKQIKHSAGTDWECTWTEFGVERRVLAPLFQQTKSPRDPELDDRVMLPKPKRIPLWKSRPEPATRIVIREEDEALLGLDVEP